MIDAHCHLNTSYSIDTIQPIIEKFLHHKGKNIVDVTTTYEEIAPSQAIIGKYPEIVYSTLGIHPETSDGTDTKHQQALNAIKQIETNLPTYKNIVGIGETGLDYSHYEEYPTNHTLVLEQQRELFVEQLALARKNGLPLVIHARGQHIADYQAYTEILDILKAEQFSLPVYFHSFGGDYELAKRIIDQGNYVGVNGIITYSNAKELALTVSKIPLERVLLETDAPFLIPSNLDRKELESAKTNEPFAIFYTAKRIAALKNCSLDEVLETTTKATRKIFAKIL